MQTDAMRKAQAARSPASSLFNADAPPLTPDQERALIEQRAESEAQELAALPTGTAQKPLTVAQVNSLVNQLLLNAIPGVLFIQGEISNFRTYDRGHAFFTLKEPGAELPCVLWKDALARLKFKPKDGLAVIARGTIKLYEPQGKLQFYVETLLPQGAGALELAFRQLCDKLRAEGLFEAARKRPIPSLPQRIVIITSKTGDVLHDVLTTAYRRFPGLHTLLMPVRVQGEQAAPDIVRALEMVNRHAEAIGGVDLILLVRGGGSLEDLWAFNEENVARAIVASRIPIATGIGHEPDTTISDLVGDLRGPTPTGVAELTIPDVADLGARLQAQAILLTRDVRRSVELAGANLQSLGSDLNESLRESLRQRVRRVDQLTHLIERIEPRHAIAQGWRRVEEAQRNFSSAAAARLNGSRTHLDRSQGRLEKASPMSRIHRQRDRVDHLSAKLWLALNGQVAASKQRMAALAGQLRVVSPHAVLERGYSITTTKDGRILRSVRDVQTGQIITSRLADGTLDSTVGKPKQGSLF